MVLHRIGLLHPSAAAGVHTGQLTLVFALPCDLGLVAWMREVSNSGFAGEHIGERVT